jgi:hypothetical protein
MQKSTLFLNGMDVAEPDGLFPDISGTAVAVRPVMVGFATFFASN